MTIKNADMPAMPCNKSIDTHESWDKLTGGGRFIPADGLTKREKFALHQSIDGLECNIIFMSEVIGREIDTSDKIDMLKAAIEFEAKIKVMKADALLKELEK